MVISCDRKPNDMQCYRIHYNFWFTNIWIKYVRMCGIQRRWHRLSFFLVFHAALQRYNFNFCHTTFLWVVVHDFFYFILKSPAHLYNVFIWDFFFSNSIVSIESFAFPLSPCLFPLSTKQRQISGVFMRCEQLEKFIDMYIRIYMKM